MIPVSRRTIASAKRCWRSFGSESKSTPSSSRPAAPTRAASASSVTSRAPTRRRSGGCPGPRCRPAPGRCRRAPAAPRRPAPPAAGTRRRRSVDDAARRPRPSRRRARWWRGRRSRGSGEPLPPADQIRRAVGHFRLSDAEAHYVATLHKVGYNSGSVLQSYLPVLVFVALGAIVGSVFALLNAVVGRKRVRSRAAKADPYECGLPSEVSRTFRFGVSFYMIAMLFILFDIEVVFLYPVGVILRRGLRLRPRRAADLRRLAAGRADLRLAPRCARLEVRREKLRGLAPLAEPGSPRAPAGTPAARPRPAARRPRRRRARGARRRSRCSPPRSRSCSPGARRTRCSR